MLDTRYWLHGVRYRSNLVSLPWIFQRFLLKVFRQGAPTDFMACLRADDVSNDEGVRAWCGDVERTALWHQPLYGSNQINIVTILVTAKSFEKLRTIDGSSTAASVGIGGYNFTKYRERKNFHV